MGIIQTENLYKTYRKGRAEALKGISFEVNEREMFGLIGPDGAQHRHLQPLYPFVQPALPPRTLARLLRQPSVHNSTLPRVHREQCQRRDSQGMDSPCRHHCGKSTAQTFRQADMPNIRRSLFPQSQFLLQILPPSGWANSARVSYKTDYTAIVATLKSTYNELIC